jgi:hypothetical protein
MRAHKLRSISTVAAAMAGLALVAAPAASAAPLTVSASCTATTTLRFSCTAVVSGGTAPYSYLWAPSGSLTTIDPPVTGSTVTGDCDAEKHHAAVLVTVTDAVNRTQTANSGVFPCIPRT